MKETIIAVASVISALTVIIGAIIAVYKIIENNKKQNVEITSIKEESALICYCIKAILQGLIERGCNGPCKDALDKLDKHLNQGAHKTNL